MTEQHPITPPPELAAHWVNVIYGKDGFGFDVPLHPITLKLAEQAAQWGADQELEACCEWLETNGHWGLLVDLRLAHLRAARRPKPPSLKEQALEEVGAFEGMGTCNIDIIRRALEALPDD